MALLGGPLLVCCALVAEKNNTAMFVKRCYLFSSRKRPYSELYVFFSLFKHSVFAVSTILFQTEFTLGLMLAYIVVEIVVVARTNVFMHKQILGLKLL